MKKSMITGLFLTFSCAVLAQTGTKATPAVRANAGKGIGQLSAEFTAGANARDAARIAATYADDAVLMPPNGESVRGRANIQAFWQGLLDQGARDVSVTPTTSSTSGSIGYEAGTYQVTIQPSGGQAVQDHGKYLVAARRGSDGQWKLIYDIYNSDLPCAPAAPK